MFTWMPEPWVIPSSRKCSSASCFYRLHCCRFKCCLFLITAYGEMSCPGLTQSSCHHNLSLVNMSQILTHCNFSYLQHISFKNCLFIQYIMYPAPWQTRLQWGQQTCSPVRVTEGQNDVQVLLWQPRLSLEWWSSVIIHLDSNSSPVVHQY